MLLDVPDDCYVITQKADDGHTYVVAGGRVFSHRREAQQVFEGMVAKFDALVATGKAAAWRPTLRGIKWSN